MKTCSQPLRKAMISRVKISREKFGFRKSLRVYTENPELQQKFSIFIAPRRRAEIRKIVQNFRLSKCWQPLSTFVKNLLRTSGSESVASLGKRTARTSVVENFPTTKVFHIIDSYYIYS